MTEKKMSIALLEKFLKEKGVKPSFHRLKILEYLYRENCHYNVDKIYREIIKEIPTLSKTTIYNTVNLFVEKGVALALKINENEVVYDHNTYFHAHLKCKKCEKIYDIDISEFFPQKDEIEGHKILDSQIYFNGICKNCLKIL